MLESFLAEVGAPFPGRDSHVDRVLRLRCQSDVAIATQGDRADIGAVAQFIGEHDFLAGGDQFVAFIGYRQPIDFCRIEKALHVVRQPEYFRAVGRLVHADAFEYGRSVMQCMRQHVNRRLLPRHQAAIQPD